MKPPAPALPLRRLALALATCLVSTTAATPSVTRQVYKTTDTRSLEIVSHLPPDWRSEDRRPAVVFFFGGGFWTWNVDQFSRQADYFARRGLVAVLVDYRTGEKDGTKPPAAFEDARGARIDWHVVEGVGHGFFNFSPHLAATTVAVDRFLQELGWLAPVPVVTLPDGDATLSETAGNPERGTAH